MIVTLHFFAGLREAIGREQATVTLAEGTTVRDLRNAIADKYPLLAGLLPAAAVAVNHEYATAERIVLASDEIALLPPVSGG